jgi:hypothetical protein
MGTERLLRDQEDEGGDVFVKIRVLASRSGPYAESDILWDWNCGFVAEEVAVGAAPRQDDGT